MRILILLALSGAVCAAGPGLTPADVFELKAVTDPQIAPDGKRIVYVRGFADIQSDTRYTNLWIVDVTGANNRPLTTGNFADASPRWSPDGTRLLYTSNRENGGQIHIRWMDTGVTTRAANLTEPPIAPTWSPDGKSIAFSMLVPSPARKLATLPAPPPGAKWADPAKIIDRIVYRFDGAGYLKPGYHQLFVIPADGGTPRQISSGDFQHNESLGRATPRITWAPDAKSVVISANRSANAELEGVESDIWEFPLDGGTPKRLTKRTGPDTVPTISPNGRLIAYTGFDDRRLGHQSQQLYVMNRDGSSPRLISGSLDRDVANPTWSADSAGLYFSYGDMGNTKLAYYPVDGPMEPISGNAALGGAFSVSADGTIAAVYTRPDVPSEAAAAKRGAALKPITAVNASLLGQRTLGAVEEIWYTSSKDNRKMHGWIVKPPSFDPLKKYPLILEIHGGPFAYYGDRFDVEKQMFAAAGYVVLYTNPRGSTSYGDDFANLIHHDYPGNDFDDLNSGVDAVIAKGYVDPARLYVTGGSGGGVLTCWTIGHTTRFRAAASLYPVINWYSFIGTADIGARVVNYWFPGMPWDNAAHYEKRSLLSVVSKVKTPTLVMTGEEDYRTPISEAEQYYSALKMLGVETVMVRVPGEPHGISRRPSHHMTKIAYIIGWFDQHK